MQLGKQGECQLAALSENYGCGILPPSTLGAVYFVVGDVLAGRRLHQTVA